MESIRKGQNPWSKGYLRRSKTCGRSWVELNRLGFRFKSGDQLNRSEGLGGQKVAN